MADGRLRRMGKAGHRSIERTLAGVGPGVVAIEEERRGLFHIWPDRRLDGGHHQRLKRLDPQAAAVLRLLELCR